MYYILVETLFNISDDLYFLVPNDLVKNNILRDVQYYSHGVYNLVDRKQARRYQTFNRGFVERATREGLTLSLVTV